MKIGCYFNKYTVFFIALVPLAVLFAWLSGLSVDNFWMIRAFDVDESGVLLDIQVMLEQNTWKPLNYIYGSAHTYFALALIKTWSLLGDVSFRVITTVSRLVNASALVGVGALFIFARDRRMASQWALLFLLVLFFAQLNFSYALNSKPELLQAFFVVFSLVAFEAFLRGKSLPWVFCSGVFAGMAFATKYAGLLVLFFLTLCLVMLLLKQLQKSSLLKFTQRILALYSGGFAGFALLGPYLVIDFPTVYQVLGIHSTIIGKGFMFLGDKKWHDWGRILFSVESFGWVLLLALAAGLIWALYNWKPDREKWLQDCLFALWGVFYLLYLVVMVNEKSARYLIILLPFCYYYVFFSLEKVAGWLVERGYRQLSKLLFAVSLVVSLYIGGSGVTSVAKDFIARTDSPRLSAGHWLSANVSHDSLLASDLYTYVPPEFSKHLHRTYLKAYDVIRTRPDFLVVSRAIMSRYLDISQADSYREGKTSFMQHYYLYAKLNDDSFPGYKIHQDFGEVVIYSRR